MHAYNSITVTAVGSPSRYSLSLSSFFSLTGSAPSPRESKGELRLWGNEEYESDREYEHEESREPTTEAEEKVAVEDITGLDHV